MFFYIAKVVWFLAVPSNFLLFCILAGAVLRATWRPRTGQRLVLFGVFGLLVCGLTPVSLWLLEPLESRFAQYKDDGQPIAGIVILGGTLETEPSIGRNQLMVNDAGERLIAMADLARRYPFAKIVFAGGGSGFDLDRPPEALIVQRWGKVLGIDPQRILTDTQSLDTHENAVAAKAVANPQAGERWLLVTSAFHMPRAVGVFRKAGWPVIAYPVDFRRGGAGDNRFFGYASEGLTRTDRAVKEYLGLLAYWMIGRTDTLFPAP